MSNSPQLHFRILSLSCPKTVKFWILLHILNDRSGTVLTLSVHANTGLAVELLERLLDSAGAGNLLTIQGLDTSGVVRELVHLLGELTGRLTVVVGAIEDTERQPTRLAIALNEKEALLGIASDTDGLFLSDHFALISRELDDIALLDAIGDESFTGGFKSLHVDRLRLPVSASEHRRQIVFVVLHNEKKGFILFPLRICCCLNICFCLN